MSPPPPTQMAEDRSPEPDREPDARPELAEVVELRERVSELESALAQKESEVEAVRHQYEAILDERDPEDGRESVLPSLFH